MRKIITLLFALSFSFAFAQVRSGKASVRKTVKAQSGTVSSKKNVAKQNQLSTVVAQDDDKIYDSVEEQPKFSGNIRTFMAENLVYPPVAVENEIEGVVIVGFVIRKDGSITDVKVRRSVDPSLDAEAERIVKLMQKWIPGKQNGKVVNTAFTLPISFRLK